MDDLLPEDATVIEFDQFLCLDQFAQTVGFVGSGLGAPFAVEACSEAGRRCTVLFDEFYASEKRAQHLLMLGFLAMDIAANVAFLLDKAAEAGDGGDVGDGYVG